MIHRTPEDRFDHLPDFPYPPRYLDWQGMRLHYLDEGDGAPVVLFHGEPTWSFLYRHVIAVLVSAGYRTIAPDYPGFGRSDKPADPDFYTYDTLTEAAGAVVDSLGLTDATAVVQDWGGPIGLRVALDRPGVFTRLSILNTGLFSGRPVTNPAFTAWRGFVAANPDLPVGMIMANAARRPWGPGVLAGYEAPFPGPEYKIGAWRLPLIVPGDTSDPGAAEMQTVSTALGSFAGPVQVLFSDGDPIFTVRSGQRLVDHMAGAAELEVVAGAGHFLQEDAGPDVGARIAAFLYRTGVGGA